MAERAGEGGSESYVCTFCGQEHETVEMTMVGVPMKVKTCPNLPRGWIWVEPSETSEAGVIDVSEHLEDEQ